MDIQWCPIAGAALGGRPDALYLGSSEVARMVDRPDGSWFALLRYPGGESIMRECTDKDTSRAGCEAWAQRHRATLEMAAERKHLEWLATQTWRGQDARDARATLNNLGAP